MDRTQLVNVGGHKSSSKALSFGVPQGSVLGTLLFTLYTSPLGDMACRHSMGYHFYDADDTQIYISFKQGSGCQTALMAIKIVLRKYRIGCLVTC